MFCSQCGTQMTGTMRFCPACGKEAPIAVPSVAAGVTPVFTPPTDKKNNKKTRIIVICVILVCLIPLFIQLMDRFVINTPAKLEDRLEDTVWYTHNTMTTKLMDGRSAISQEKWEFHNENTVTVTKYIYVTYGDIPKNPEYEWAATEELEWEITDNCTLIVDGRKYKFRSVLMRGEEKWEDAWGLEKDTLHMGRTYEDSADWAKDIEE